MSEATKKVEMTHAEVVLGLTNGCGEKPYCRRVDGQMVVFVADEQEYCLVGLIDNDMDESIAQAICEVGIRLESADREIAELKGALAGNFNDAVEILLKPVKQEIADKDKRITELEVYEDVYKGRTDVPELRKRIKELEEFIEEHAMKEALLDWESD